MAVRAHPTAPPRTVEEVLADIMARVSMVAAVVAAAWLGATL